MSYFMIASAGFASYPNDKCPATMEPPIPGVMPGLTHPKIILGVDIDYPPYGTLSFPPDTEDIEVAGFGPDIAAGMKEVCNIEVHTTQINWNECWGSNKIGESLKAGYLHGCATYTHTVGVRNRYMEFSAPILDANKEAGFFAKLDDNGIPLVKPGDDLQSKTVVDVTGWAPTADTTAVLMNDCTATPFSRTMTVVGTDDTTATGSCTPTDPTNANHNDIALCMVLNGLADVAYIYSDQAYQYIKKCAADGQTSDTGLCADWQKFGQPGGFAYIHSGMPEFTKAGTTLAMSKIGSGIKDILDPCINAFLQTESYYKICQKWDLVSSCFANNHFPGRRELLAKDSTGTRHVGRKLADGEALYNIATNEQENNGCNDGYCSCAD